MVAVSLKKKVKGECIKDLNVKCKTIKLLEDHKGENLDDLEYGDDSRYNTKGTIHERK